MDRKVHTLMMMMMMMMMMIILQYCQWLYYTTSNGRIICELERIWKEGTMIYVFVVLYRNSCRSTE
jgi:hypothetical protein